MAKDGGMGNIVLLGGLAVGGYFLYQYLSAGSLPADAVFVGFLDSVSAGKTVTLGGQTFTAPSSGTLYIYFGPSENKYYPSSTRPTAAQMAAGQSAGMIPNAGGGAGTSTSTAGTTGATNPPAAQSLDSVYTKLKAAVAGDPNFTGSGDALSGSPDHWAYYLNLLYPGNSANLDALFPAPNRSSPVTAAQFWTAVGPGLGKQFGLSGLGLYAGLGAYLHDRGAFPHGWA